MTVKRTIFAGGKTGRSETRSMNILLSDYKAFKDVVESEAYDIMLEAANIVLQETLPHVPVETGALRESGKAEATKTIRGTVAKVSFGGEENPVTPTKNAPQGIVDYAVIVHEDIERDHPEGEAKFLEIGYITAEPKVNELVISRLSKIAQ